MLMPRCAGILNYQDVPITYSIDVNKDVMLTYNERLKRYIKSFVKAMMFGHRHRYTRKERILYTLKQLRKRGCICYTKQFKQQTQMI